MKHAIAATAILLAAALPATAPAQTVSADFGRRMQTIAANGINMEGYHVGQWEELREDFAAMLRQLPCNAARIGAPMIEWEPANDNGDADSIRWEGLGTDHIFVTRSVNRIRRMRHEFGVDVWLSIWNLPDWLLENPNPAGALHPARRINDIDEAAESICALLLHIKRQTGVEVRWVSFNESLQQDREDGGWGGYNTLLTVDEYIRLITKAGELFRRHGLHTKWMVGTLSIKPSELRQVQRILADRRVRRHVAAVDFHGYDIYDMDDGTIRRWGDYFAKSRIPAMCGELDNYKSDYRGGDWAEHGMKTARLYNKVYNGTRSVGSFPWFPAVPEEATTYRYADLHFFAHIPSGFTVVASESSDDDIYAVAARQGDRRVMILQNNSPETKHVRIGGFKPQAHLEVYESYTGNYGVRHDGALQRDNGVLTLTMQPYSLYSIGTGLTPLKELRVGQNR